MPSLIDRKLEKQKRYKNSLGKIFFLVILFNIHRQTSFLTVFSYVCVNILYGNNEKKSGIL